MKSIELERIPQKTIRTFIKDQIQNNVVELKDLKSTYKEGDDLSDYLHHEEIFKVNHPIEKVWDHYMNANPGEVWNGKMLSFGVMVSKNDGEIMYVGDQYSTAKPGQIFYIELNIFGVKKLAVSHEIIGIKADKKYFELSYVEGSKSYGKQRIAFYKTGEGSTRIVHSTRYKSDSNFRDRYVYPYFHTKVIGEYHANMANSIK